MREQRDGGRHPVEHPVVLMLASDAGATVHTGVTVEVGRGGCSVRLDEAIEPRRWAGATGVLLVQLARREVAALTGAPLLEDEPTRTIRLTLVPAVAGDGGWAEWVRQLEDLATVIVD